MKESLPMVRKESWWDKIKAVFSKKVYVEEQKEIKTEAVTDSYLEREQAKSKRRHYLLELQEKFERGEIASSEIASEDVVELRELYVEQIEMLKRSVKQKMSLLKRG